MTKQGEIINDEHLTIPMDESSDLYWTYVSWLQAGGTVLESDYITTNASAEFNRMLREEYSEKISNIVGMREAIERFAIDGTPIPQEIIDEREALKQEYDSKLQ